MSATAMAAATKAASMTAAESTACAAAESAAACWCCTSARSANIAASSAGITTCSTGITACAAVATATVAEAATHVVAGVTVEAPVVPRADADEEPAIEPAGSVIAVGCAGIGVVRVITPIAGRRTIGIRGVNDCGADSDTDSHLGVCRCRERQSQK